jgi:hypothetical protein
MTRVGGIVIVMALIAAWVIFFWPGVLGELHWEESRAPKAGGVVHLPFDPCGRWRPDRLLLWASPCHGCPEEGRRTCCRSKRWASASRIRTFARPVNRLLTLLYQTLDSLPYVLRSLPYFRRQRRAAEEVRAHIFRQSCRHCWQAGTMHA